MRVSELMSSDLVTVTADAPLAACAQALVRARVRHLPVVDADGALTGVVVDAAVFRCGGFVERDRGWLSFEPEYDALAAASVAVPADVVLSPDDDLDTALRQLYGTRQDFAVVVDDRRHPIGIITEHDGVRVALAFLPRGIDAAQEGTKPVLTVPRDRRGSEALDLMKQREVRHLVVTDVDGSIYGVLSYRDLVADDVVRRPEVKAEDVVRSRIVYSARVGVTLRDVATTMRDQRIGCVPIVDDGRPVAIVTRRDLIDAAVSSLEAAELFGEASADSL